jgi:hypothetical protein
VLYFLTCQFAVALYFDVVWINVFFVMLTNIVL